MGSPIDIMLPGPLERDDPPISSLGEQAGKARQAEPFALHGCLSPALGCTRLESPVTPSAPAFDYSYI